MQYLKHTYTEKLFIENSILTRSYVFYLLSDDEEIEFQKDEMTFYNAMLSLGFLRLWFLLLL